MSKPLKVKPKQLAAWRRRRQRQTSGRVRIDGSPCRDGFGQVRGQLAPTAKLTDRIALSERQRARSIRTRHGELPIGWTSERAALLDISRSAYEKMLYGQSYAHVPFALARPSHRRRAIV
jgi:hypothetical protein